LTTTIRGFGSEVWVGPGDGNGLDEPSAAQCQHLRAVSTARVEVIRGNVGTATVTQIREVIGLVLDIS
jgi:mRNA-degrading endonuclease toxin of MazEF toxin-antitoxin module